jgi:5'-nucleotidase
MEGAGNGIPALAVSLETDESDHLSYSKDIDFSAAAYFTSLFGRAMLERHLPEDVDLLKVDVPCDATSQTPWVVNRLSRQAYFVPITPTRASWDQPERVGYRRIVELGGAQADTDVYALRVRRLVSVTPVSLDMTSRVDLQEFDHFLRDG